MQEKSFLYFSFLIIFVPLVKFDIFIYPTIDYFGKFVAVVVLNVVPFWITKMLFEIKRKNIAKFASLAWALFIGSLFFSLS